jgi:hypothetical protein
MPAPVALFVYNRPRQTLQMLRSLKANELAEKSELFIFCDGAKENADSASLKAIKEVRKIVRSERWCREVHVIESDVNMGLAESIIGGIGRTISISEELIILEDDLILSPVTLGYLNSALEFYRDEEKVMSISAYMFPLEKKKNRDNFFLQLDATWGWATWSRAWKKFQPDAAALKKQLQQSGKMKIFDFGSTGECPKLLDMQINQLIDSWGIRWHASIVIENGLTLYPASSFINNAGMDGSGTHRLVSKKYFNSKLNQSTVHHFPIVVEENQDTRKTLEIFYSEAEKKIMGERIFQKIKNQFSFKPRL